MKVIGIISQKGGVGKTTIAVNLAIAAEKLGISTVLLDLDPQCSASTYGDERLKNLGDEAGPDIASIQAGRLDRVLEAMRKDDAQLCVLDTPPYSGDIALAAVKASDVVVTPCRPSILDISAIKRTVDILKTAGKHQSAFGLVSCCSPVPNHQALANQTQQALESFGLSVPDIRIRQRSTFVHAATVGEGAVEYEPKSSAAKEVAALLQFLLDQMEFKNRIDTKEARVHG